MDKGNEEIAKSIMLEIQYDNGVIDRYNPEYISPKWLELISEKAGAFFDLHPELLTDENIELICLGNDDGHFEGFNEIEGYSELNKVLDDFFDDGFGITYTATPILFSEN
jgi:hypothetical protein